MKIQRRSFISVCIGALSSTLLILLPKQSGATEIKATWPTHVNQVLSINDLLEGNAYKNCWIYIGGYDKYKLPKSVLLIDCKMCLSWPDMIVG